MRRQALMAAAFTSVNGDQLAKLSLYHKVAPGPGESALCQARRPQDPSFSLNRKGFLHAHINSTVLTWLQAVGLLPAIPFGSWCAEVHQRSSAASDALERFETAGPDRLNELLVVPLVLVGVATGEVGDGSVELIAFAQAGGDGDRVPRPGVRPRQRPPAGPCVERERERRHGLDIGRALHVTQLAPVVVAVVSRVSGPAEVYVAGGLHHPLAHHHPLAVLPVRALAHAWLQDRSDRLFDLQEEGIMRVTPLKQNDERLTADAANADHLVGHVDDLEPIEQAALVLAQRGPVGLELLADHSVEVVGGGAGYGGQVARRDHDRRLGGD